MDRDDTEPDAPGAFRRASVTKTRGWYAEPAIRHGVRVVAIMCPACLREWRARPPGFRVDTHGEVFGVGHGVDHRCPRCDHPIGPIVLDGWDLGVM